MGKFEKPPRLQVEMWLKRNGLEIPPTEWATYRISMFLGFPRADADLLQLMLRLQKKWVGKQVTGGANLKAPGRFQGMKGTVLAVVPRTEDMKREIRLGILETGHTPDMRLATFELYLRWDPPRIPQTAYAPLCYFSLVDNEQLARK